MKESISPFHPRQGFGIVLVAIILAAVMMILALSLTSSTLSLRYNAEEARQKAFSQGLAFSCAEQALLVLAQNPAYSGNETKTIGTYQCVILPIETLGQQKIIKTTANVSGAITNLKTTVQPIPFKIVSQEEVASW